MSGTLAEVGTAQQRMALPIFSYYRWNPIFVNRKEPISYLSEKKCRISLWIRRAA